METDTPVLLFQRRERKWNERLSFPGPLFSNVAE